MTFNEYKKFKELKDKGNTYQQIIDELKLDLTASVLRGRYNRALKKYDNTYHTTKQQKELIELEKESNPDIIYHNIFSSDDLGILKEMIQKYKDEKISIVEEVEIFNWDLPKEYIKIKNTQTSIRMNKVLYEDLKKEVHKIDKEIKTTDIINKAMCDLLLKIKRDI